MPKKTDKKDTPEKPKAAAKKAPASKPKSDFPPLPDAGKAGPPFTFDGNNHCANPILTVLRLPAQVIAYLCAAERDGTWYGVARVDCPGNDRQPKGWTYGTVNPGASTGYRAQAQALFEAGRDALNYLKTHFGKTGASKEAKQVLFECENAVKALTPPAAKLVVVQGDLTGYRPQDAGKYMETFAKFAGDKANGVVLPESMTRDEAKNFALGLAHVGRNSEWIIADWYLFCQKHHKDLLDEMLKDEARTTISNKAAVAKKFAPDERIPELSFTHHMEASFESDKKKRAALLQKALTEGLSVAKLRALVNAGKPPLPTPKATPILPPATSTTESATGAPTSPAAAPAVPQGTDTAPEPENPAQTPVATQEEEFIEEATPQERAESDYEALIERLDEAQTLIRRGAIDPEFIQPGRVHQVRVIITQLAESVALTVT